MPGIEKDRPRFRVFPYRTDVLAEAVVFTSQARPKSPKRERPRLVQTFDKCSLLLKPACGLVSVEFQARSSMALGLDVLIPIYATVRTGSPSSAKFGVIPRPGASLADI